MAEKFERPVAEEGVVVSKYITPATSEFIIEGKTIPAKNEAMCLKIVSGFEFDQKTGYSNCVCLEYPVDSRVYQNAFYGDKVKVVYFVSSRGAKVTNNSKVELLKKIQS